MEKRNICLSITHIRSHVTFGNNLPEAKAKKVRFYFVTLKWHRSTCYLNWAILIGDLVDITTLLLALPSTIPCYILPTPLSYYHAACLLRPCSFLISSPDSFSIYCITPCNHYLQYWLGSLPRQPNGSITFLRNKNQFYPSTIPILSLV